MTHASRNSAGGTNSSVEPANLKIIQEGVQRWKEWWKSHQQDYPANSWRVRPTRPAELLPMADFRLKDLKGRTVRFSDFKGKVVLFELLDDPGCPGCLGKSRT